MGLVRWSLRFAWLIVFGVMLAANVATLTVSGVAALANGALAAAGVSTVAARSAARAAAAAPARAAARAATRRVSARVARGAARSAGSVLAQSVPFVGAAAVVGVTAWEIGDACAMLEDLEELEAALDALEPGAVPAGAEAERDRVCGLQVPSVDEVRAAIAAAPGEALAEARGWMEGAPEAGGPPPAGD
ncbi:MAG: hypothetical protein ACU0DT_13740 [Albimonas sp.]|uniref:hypothetical protein n=1 Tax=Albimonas sp. TaxID=1872425 RepID=UPI0040561E24